MKTQGGLLITALVFFLLLTAVCAVLPSSGFVRLMSKTMPTVRTTFGEKYQLDLPYGFKKTSQNIKAQSLFVTYELRADKALYQWSLFSLSYEQLLTLMVSEDPGRFKNYGTLIEIKNYAAPVTLYDDYSEDGHSNHTLTLYDETRSLRLVLIIDKSRFTKAESIDILLKIFSSFQKIDTRQQ